jgi:molybdenum cofactor guanylyltransferase
MTQANLYGVVLSGGRSSRMGVDKGALIYHHEPQRQHLFNLLSRYCEEVYTSCREDHKVVSGLHPLTDRYSFNSPLSGILTAFSLFPSCAWLSVPVDLPNINDEVLSLLISRRDTQKLATCFMDNNTGAPEPLLTIWEPHSFPTLLENCEHGEVSPRKFLQTNDVHIITVAPSSWFVNINSPEERQRFKGA